MTEPLNLEAIKEMIRSLRPPTVLAHPDVLPGDLERFAAQQGLKVSRNRYVPTDRLFVAAASMFELPRVGGKTPNPKEQ